MNDEIDLIEVFLKLVRFIKSKIKVILFILIIGSLSGIGVYFLQPDKFAYKVSAYSPYINKDVILNGISEFSSKLKANVFNEEDYEIQLMQIKAIETNIEEGIIEISVIANNEIDINVFVSSLDKYISKNSFINEKIQHKKDQLNNTVTFFNDQIKKLNNQSELNIKDNNIIISEETAASLYLKKISFEENLKFLKPLVFTNFSHPQNKKYSLLNCIFAGAILSLFLLFGYFFLVKINSLVKTTYPKNTQINLFKDIA